MNIVHQLLNENAKHTSEAIDCSKTLGDATNKGKACRKPRKRIGIDTAIGTNIDYPVSGFELHWQKQHLILKIAEEFAVPEFQQDLLAKG